MSTVTITTRVIPDWQPRYPAVELWIFLDVAFFDSDGVYHLAGDLTNQIVAKRAVCTVDLSAHTLTIPIIQLASTTDGNGNQSRYSAYFVVVKNNRATKPIAYEGFDSFILGSSPSTQTWEDIAGTNLNPVPGYDLFAYPKAESDRRYATFGSGVQIDEDNAFTGLNRFASLIKFGNGITVDDGAWANTGAEATMVRAADSSAVDLLSSGIPSTVYQTWRTGGSPGIGVFGYEYGFMSKGAGGSGGDTYAFGILNRYERDMTGFANGDYFQIGAQLHVVLNPSNKPAGANVYGFNVAKTDRLVANVRGVGLQSETVNYGGDGDDDPRVQNSTIAHNAAGGGIYYNSAAYQIESGVTGATSFAVGVFPKRNSVRQYLNDFSAGGLYDVAGGPWGDTRVVSVTSGSPTITGTGTRFRKEILKGDQVTIDGVTWYEVASTPLTDTSLTLTTSYAGGNASDQPLVKTVQPFRLVRPTYLTATDTLTTFKLIGLDQNNRVRLDNNGTGIFAGTTPLRLTNAAGSVVIADDLTLVNGLNSNIPVSGASIVYARAAGPTGAFSIGGFTGGARVIYLFQITLQAMTIKNEDLSTAAGGRIVTKTFADVVLPAGQSCATCVYSDADSRYVLFSTMPV
jgi:hypothetical protein